MILITPCDPYRNKFNRKTKTLIHKNKCKWLATLFFIHILLVFTIKVGHATGVAADKKADYYTIKADSIVSPRPNYDEEKGYNFIVENGLMIGRHSPDNAHEVTFSLHTIHGYSFSRGLNLGVGVGIDQHHILNAIPLYLSLRGDFSDKKVTSFYFINTGYSHVWLVGQSSSTDYEDVKGKMYFHPGLGLKIKYSDTALLISVGYKLQNSELKYTEFAWYGLYNFTEERLFKRFTINIGLAF